MLCRCRARLASKFRALRALLLFGCLQTSRIFKGVRISASASLVLKAFANCLQIEMMILSVSHSQARPLIKLTRFELRTFWGIYWDLHFFACNTSLEIARWENLRRSHSNRHLGFMVTEDALRSSLINRHCLIVIQIVQITVKLPKEGQQTSSSFTSSFTSSLLT